MKSRPVEAGCELSVVLPVYNEAESLPIFVTKLIGELDSLSTEYEVIFVDDGSDDESASLLAKMPVRRGLVIELARNYGQMAALDAGLRASTGQWILTMDADGQHPPNLIHKFLDEAKNKNLDVVFGRMVTRSYKGPVARTLSPVYYFFQSLIIGRRALSDAGDFRLVSRLALNHVLTLGPGAHSFRALFQKLGLPSSVIEIEPDRRVAGTTKYTLTKMMSLAGKLFEIPGAVGRLSLILSVVALSVLVTISFLAGLSWLAGGTIPGWTSLMLLMSAGFTTQIVISSAILLGVLAVSRVQSNFPSYIVRRVSRYS